MIIAIYNPEKKQYDITISTEREMMHEVHNLASIFGDIVTNDQSLENYLLRQPDRKYSVFGIDEDQARDIGKLSIAEITNLTDPEAPEDITLHICVRDRNYLRLRLMRAYEEGDTTGQAIAQELKKLAEAHPLWKLISEHYTEEDEEWIAQGLSVRFIKK
jgi:hypothetical protein